MKNKHKYEYMEIWECGGNLENHPMFSKLTKEDKESFKINTENPDELDKFILSMKDLYSEIMSIKA